MPVPEHAPPSYCSFGTELPSRGNRAVGTYKAMDTIASLITQEKVEREPLKYQLKTSFQNLSDGEQLKVVKKAKEDCLHVCSVIAPR